MTSFIYTAAPHNSINMASDAAAIKVALLLSDKLVVTSNAVNHTFMVANLFNMPFEAQLDFYFQKYPTEAANGFGSAEEVLGMFKAFKKMKHPPTKMIVLVKKFKATFKDLFEDSVKEMDNHMSKFGFPQLGRVLIPAKARHLEVWVENPEDGKPPFVPASKIFRFDSEIFPEGIPLWVMHFEAFVKNQWWNSRHKPIYLEKIFSFDNLNLLTAEELFVANQNLEPTMKQLREQIDLWRQRIADGQPSEVNQNFLQKILNGPPSNDNHQFLLKNVVPAAAQPQQATNENPIMAALKKIEGQTGTINVMLGEIYVADLWAFYRQHHSIEDNTWEAITSHSQYAELSKQKIAIMALEITKADELVSKPNAATEEVVSVRKSLDID